MIVLSSSSVHFSFTISGLRWLCHRSRHCLPILPGRCLATKLQFFGPLLFTNLSTNSSYSEVYINSHLPKAPLSNRGSAPFANGAGTARQFYPPKKRRSFSNYELHTIKQVVLVFRPTGESTNASGRWRAGWVSVNSKINFVDMRTRQLYWRMMGRHPANLKRFQSWSKCCYFCLQPCRWRRVCAGLNSRSASMGSITTITANLLPWNRSFISANINKK